MIRNLSPKLVALLTLILFFPSLVNAKTTEPFQLSTKHDLNINPQEKNQTLPYSEEEIKTKFHQVFMKYPFLQKNEHLYIFLKKNQIFSNKIMALLEKSDNWSEKSIIRLFTFFQNEELFDQFYDFIFEVAAIKGLDKVFERITPLDYLGAVSEVLHIVYLISIGETSQSLQSSLTFTLLEDHKNEITEIDTIKLNSSSQAIHLYESKYFSFPSQDDFGPDFEKAEEILDLFIKKITLFEKMLDLTLQDNSEVKSNYPPQYWLGEKPSKAFFKNGIKEKIPLTFLLYLPNQPSLIKKIKNILQIKSKYFEINLVETYEVLKNTDNKKLLKLKAPFQFLDKQKKHEFQHQNTLEIMREFEKKLQNQIQILRNKTKDINNYGAHRGKILNKKIAINSNLKRTLRSRLLTHTYNNQESFEYILQSFDIEFLSAFLPFLGPKYTPLLLLISDPKDWGQIYDMLQMIFIHRMIKKRMSISLSYKLLHHIEKLNLKEASNNQPLKQKILRLLELHQHIKPIATKWLERENNVSNFYEKTKTMLHHITEFFHQDLNQEPLIQSAINEFLGYDATNVIRHFKWGYCSSDSNLYEYLLSKGVSKEVIELSPFFVSLKKINYGNSISIPIFNNKDQVEYIIFRDLSPKKSYSRYHHPPIANFNIAHNFYPQFKIYNFSFPFLLLTESTKGTAFLHKKGYSNVFAINHSSKLTEDQFSQIKTIIKEKKLKMIILSLDGDEAGEKGTQVLKEQFESHQINFKILQLPKDKDLEDMTLTDEDWLYKELTKVLSTEEWFKGYKEFVRNQKHLFNTQIHEMTLLEESA